MRVDACWASVNVGLMHSVVWNNSRYTPLGQFYVHCGIEGTGIPGIICIICHQVLRHPSEHGTCSMGKHWLAKAHITKLSGLTWSEVMELTTSKVDDSALAKLKSQESQGITIVSSQRKFIVDI